MVFELAVQVVFRSRRKLSGTVAWLGCRLRRIAIGNLAHRLTEEAALRALPSMSAQTQPPGGAVAAALCGPALPLPLNLSNAVPPWGAFHSC
jgi:hypothetical protein